MKKKQSRQRKLRTQSFNHWHRSVMTSKGLMPFCEATVQWFGVDS